MLYTLVGNGNANPREVIAALSSLRSAVHEPDEFWMAFVNQEPSDTVATIVTWLDTEGIYYEVVGTDGIDTHDAFLKADVFHPARRPLDFLVKLTKNRVQPGEKSAILVLSDDLDNDDVVMYTVERAFAEGLPIYDLAGQMTQIVLDTEEDEELAAEAEHLGQDVLVPKAGLSDVEIVDDLGPAELETPSAQDFTLPGVNGESTHVPNYTRADLEDLTRDELKSLVKTTGVVDCDLRSKPSMIEALLRKSEEHMEEGYAEIAKDAEAAMLDNAPEFPHADPDPSSVSVDSPEPEIHQHPLASMAGGIKPFEMTPTRQAVVTEALNPPNGVLNILVVNQDRSVRVVPVPENMTPVILSILESQ